MAMTSPSILCLVLALVAKPVMAEKGCYKVSQTSHYWVSNYGVGLPDNPHHSEMVLTMHTEQYTMSAVNMSATAGVQNMAEEGNPTAVQNEITASSAAMESTKVPPTNLTGQATKLGFADFMMEADSDFPHVSLITMIVPSPDWFAFGSAMLFENGAFQTKAIDVYAYDAGTDSGTSYTSANDETSPKGTITELMSGVTGANTVGVRKMMTMTFTPSCSVTTATTTTTTVTSVQTACAVPSIATNPTMIATYIDCLGSQCEDAATTWLEDLSARRRLAALAALEVTCTNILAAIQNNCSMKVDSALGLLMTTMNKSLDSDIAQAVESFTVNSMCSSMCGNKCNDGASNPDGTTGGSTGGSALVNAAPTTSIFIPFLMLAPTAFVLSRCL